MEKEMTGRSENLAESESKEMDAVAVSGPPYRIRLKSHAVPVYTGAGTEYVGLDTISDDRQLEIIEESQGKGQKLWGRLRSNAGWILLEQAERLTI